MEFKLLLLCFALFVATSAASVCKCGPEKKDPVSKYKVKVKDGDEEVEEEFEFDTEKQTETIRSKTDSTTGGTVDVIFDFKRNLSMHRVSALKACFLSDGTENQPKPDDLKKALDQLTKEKVPDMERSGNSTDYNYRAVSTVTDRSGLSDEMAHMCAKLPIYRVKKTNSPRAKRCIIVTVRYCPPCYRNWWHYTHWHYYCPSCYYRRYLIC